MSMLMRDGQLVKSVISPQNRIATYVQELTAPSFAPSYVPRIAAYTKANLFERLATFGREPSRSG